MKLADLVKKVAPTVGMKPGELMKACDAVFDAIKETVTQGEKVSIAGMGSFMLRQRPAGERVDPRTGQMRVIEAASSFGFKPATPKGSKKRKAISENSVPAAQKS